MYESLWKIIEKELSGANAKKFACAINKHARWCTTPEMERAARTAARIMKRIGLDHIELIPLPADGRTSFCGWVNPVAWDVEKASLRIVTPQTPRGAVLADYRKDPYALMVRSAPTPPEGIEAELIVVDNASTPSSFRGKDVKGKIVLIDGSGYAAACEAFKRGAVGLLADSIPPNEFRQSASEADDLRFWHGFTLPVWDTPKTGFGFSITPRQGRMLRDRLKAGKKVVLKATVRSRLYSGKLNILTGLIPGATDEEIALTAHMYEPGADDNASGVGLALEIARCINTLIRQGRIKRPRRGLRLLFGMEVRGTNAYLALHPAASRLRAGLNIDMVGADPHRTQHTCTVSRSLPCTPSYAEHLMAELLGRAQKTNSSLRHKLSTSYDTDDNAMSDWMFNAPSAIVCQMPATHWHVNVDRPEILSETTFSTLGTAFGVSLVLLTQAGYEEGKWLSDLTFDAIRRDIVNESADILRGRSEVFKSAMSPTLDERIAYLADQATRKLRSVLPLVKVPIPFLIRTGWNYMDKLDYYDADRDLRKDVLLQRHVAKLESGIQRFIAEEAASLRSRLAEQNNNLLQKLICTIPVNSRLRRKALRIVPRKTQPGFLAWDSIPDKARASLLKAIGKRLAWSAPEWAQSAVLWSDGKRTLLDIWERIRAEGKGVSLERLLALMENLREQKLVTFVPVITKQRIVKTLRNQGVREGDVMFVHTSLSYFGYIEGGADMVIEAFLETVGATGTLVMPTFTFSRKGAEPFERKTSPSRVGVITEFFRQRPGVLRSAHPSHSVSAFGPLAKKIAGRHSCRDPLVGPKSPFGRLYGLNAWILMFCNPRANTMIHMGEYRGGVPFLDGVYSIKKKGCIKEVVVRAIPCHGRFDEVYDRMARQGLLRKAKLGEKHLLLMKAKDAVDIATDYFGEDPLRAAEKNCTCLACRHIRKTIRNKRTRLSRK